MFRLLSTVATLLLALALLLIGHGVQVTIVPLRAASEGFSEVWIGILGSAYFAGFILGALTLPSLIRRQGHIRAFALFTVCAVVATLAQPMIVSFPAWILFRTAVGICLAGVYLIVESWLNATASNATRGFLLSAYVTVDFLAMAIGQLLVAVGPTGPVLPFAAAAIVMALAAVPILATSMTEPPPLARPRFDPARFLRTSPAGVAAVVGIGVAQGCLFALGPIFAAGKGLDTAGAALFMGAAILGGTITQAPLGRLSDHRDRREVLVALLTAAVAFGIILSFLPAGDLLYVLAFLLGAALLPTYAIAAAHIYDRTAPANYVDASGGTLLLFGVGSVLGPFLAALVMRGAGAWTLFLFTGVVETVLIGALLLLWRLRPDPPPHKLHFADAAVVPGGIAIPPDASDAHG